MLIVIPVMRTPSFTLQVAFFVTLAGWSSAFLLPRCPLCIAQSVSKPTVSTAQFTAPSNSESNHELALDQKVSRYRALLELMRDEIRLITEAKMRFYLDGVDASYNWKDQWETAVETIEPLRAEFETLATDLFINHADDAGVPESLPDAVFAIRRKLLLSDRDADTISVLRRLLRLQPDHDQLKLDLGRVLLKTNQFAQANELIDSIAREVFEKLEGADDDILMVRSQLQSAYEKEKKILAAEALADDLPRVELMTTQGPVVVELFENEAPDTVGNFIHLVENGFYTDIVFHRVIAGFMAQTGTFVRTGNGYANKSIAYTIYDETRNGRQHFSGYLSMAKTDKPDSGGSQFFITYAPTGFLDGRHTVFGRVIQGMENVGRFEVTFEMKEGEKDKPPKEELIESAIPDRILTAEVIRKRDHQYTPNKVTTN